MDDEKLRQRLRQVTLSAPGISFAQARERAAAEHARRRSPSVLRLAIAAAAVWLVALAIQVSVERSLPTMAPAMTAVKVAEGGDQGGNAKGAYAQQRELLRELIAGGQVEALPEPERPRGSSDDRRSSMTYPREGWMRHV